MLTKLKQIYSGWKNLAIKDPDIEKLSEDRMRICKDCYINVNNVCNRERGGCGCPLSAATRSPNKKCPKGKW